MKVYVHYEPDDSEFEYTAAITLSTPDDLHRIKREFKQQYETFHLNDVELVIVNLLDEDDFPIKSVTDMMDVFIKGTHKVSKSKKKKEKIEMGPKSININFVKIREQQEEAAKLFQARKFRQALNIYEELKESFLDKIGAIRNMAQIYYFAERYEKSLELVKEGMSIKQDDANLRELYIDNLISLRRYSEAMRQIPMARQLYVQEGKKEQVQDMEVKEGKCLYAMGRRAQGFQKFTNILRERNMQHMEALVEYAISLLEINRDEKEALTILVKVLTQRPDTRVEGTVVSIVERDKGLKNLMAVFQRSGGKEFAEAMTWIAGICEKYGCIEKSLEILSHLLKKSSRNELKEYFWRWIRAKFLNYLRHLRYNSAFVEAKVALKLKQKSAIGGVEISEFLKPISQLKIHPQRKIHEDLRVFYDEKESELVMEQVSKDQFIVFPKSEVGNEELKAKLTTPYGKSDKIEYSKDELEFLGMMFQLVRFLYERGFVFPYVLELIEVIEKVRLRSKKRLHLSSIRNEQAYYLYICHLVKYLMDQKMEKVSDPSKIGKPIYVVGDSHILSLSFQEIVVKGLRRRFIPHLIPGLKCFHFLSHSYRKVKPFYTKVHFDRVIDEIPFACDILFVLGELDVREGLPGALEKLKFDEVAEGIEKCVDGYFSSVNEARTRKEFRNIFVHPVFPVIFGATEFLENSKKWNFAMAEKLQKERKFVRLRYLKGIFENIIEDDKVKQEFVFDGTHLHPKYLNLVEKGVQETYR